MVDGLKLYEELFDDSEVSKFVSLVNDLRAAGKRGQLQGKFTNAFFFQPLGRSVTSIFPFTCKEKSLLIFLLFSFLLSVFRSLDYRQNLIFISLHNMLIIIKL